MPAEARRAPVAQLRERHALVEAAAQVLDALPALRRRAHLFQQDGSQVSRMQAIARLTTLTGESDVFQRPAAQIGVDPEGKNALVRPPKLSGPGEHAAAVNPDGQAEGLPVLQGQTFRGQLGAAIERNGWPGGKP